MHILENKGTRINYLALKRKQNRSKFLQYKEQVKHRECRRKGIIEIRADINVIKKQRKMKEVINTKAAL